MKAFLKKLGWFTLFSLVLGIATMFLVIALNRLAVNNCDLDDSIDTVIVGDSHTMWSIDAGEIENVANVSLNAEGYVYTYYKLRHLLENEPNVSRVYLGFGYHNLSGYFDDYIFGPRFTGLIDRYMGVMSAGDFLRAIANNPQGISTMVRNMLQRGIRSGLKQRCTLYGSFPEERMTEEYDRSQMEKRIRGQYYDDTGAVLETSAINLEYLDRIVALAREKGLDITLLNTPMHSEYARSVPTEYLELYREYIDRHGLPVYQFEDLSLSDADFLPDGDHVNYQGATLTTAKFRILVENDS